MPHCVCVQSRDWSHFNQESQEWGSYWERAGVAPLPGPPPLSPALLKLGSFTYKVGLLRPSQAHAAVQQASAEICKADRPVGAGERKSVLVESQPEIVPAEEEDKNGGGCGYHAHVGAAGDGRAVGRDGDAWASPDSRVSADSGVGGVARTSQHEGSTQAQRGSVAGTGAGSTGSEGVQGERCDRLQGKEEQWMEGEGLTCMEGVSLRADRRQQGWGRLKGCLCMF